MSTPDEADATISGGEADTAVGSSSTGGSSTSSSSSSSSSPSRSSSTTDSRRVAPKWLGKKIGRFRLQALLGAGAVGRVFRAEDAILHRRVALKVIALHGEDGQINRNADQFLTEARAAAALEHPHVVQIFEAGESGNLCYIAMELLDGGSLKELVDAGGPMDPARACLLAADAAEALAAGHQAGIVHRDIKPANLMISRQGRCKVTDFGLATFADADSISRDKAAGTPLYAAPEVIRGTTADERSDIYSLGASLYFLLTGRPPYKAKTRAEVLRMHLEEPIPDLRQVRPGLPESLVAAVERSLDKDPGQRFTSATQFARVLRVQTVPVSAMSAAAAAAAAAAAGGQLTAAALPPLDTSPGASLMGLSGMTPVVGSSSGRLGVTGNVGSLSAGDLPAVPAAAAAPVVDYKSPPPVVGRPWWRSPAALIGMAVAAVALLGVLGLFFSVSPRRPPAVATLPLVPPPASVLPLPSPTARPTTAPAKPAVTIVRLTPAERVPIAVTDVDHLKAIANGTDVDRPNRYATIVGAVAATELSPTGKTVRIEFPGTSFVIVYFDTNSTLYQRMAERFGDHSSMLVGRTIRVTGRVKLFGKDPELILTTPDAVKVQ